MSTESILLQPRPLAQVAGRLLLLPLLPHRPALKPLPSEIWWKIIGEVLGCGHQNSRRSHGIPNRSRLALLTICKGLKEIGLPIFYSQVNICTITSFQQFTARLSDADQKWDSIRRIPYSTPGRWVQNLDLSDLAFTSQSEAFLLDSLLTQVFPLVPFLVRLALNPSFVLSRRAIDALAAREGSIYLRCLEGISYVPSADSSVTDGDPLVQLLRCCVNLEELEIIGPGLDPTEFAFVAPDSAENPCIRALDLQHLHTMTLLSMHSSPLMFALLNTPLPALQKLTLTPYDDIPFPASLASQFISTLGYSLRSLLLDTPKSWPTRLHPSPATVLHTCPNLTHLSLENPLPTLSVPSILASHPLRILSIPRPKSDYWKILEGYLPHLPHLRIIRARDVRWLRRGMTLHAQGAGVQGEMREWNRRLCRRGIKVLDADWKECE